MAGGGEFNAGGNNADPINLSPVAPEQSGEGLPYAPENWPNPGDVWKWRAGKRVAATGYFKDRYLYPPAHLCSGANSGSSRKRVTFASKLAVQRFVEKSFPDANIEDFFASFSWRIPANCPGNGHAHAAQPISVAPPHLLAPEEERAVSVSPSRVAVCKVGNRNCRSLALGEEDEKLPPVLHCNVCCANPRFCRECCCLLCNKTLDYAYGGYSYVMCSRKIRRGKICGHAVHLECALYNFVAGKVGGTIGLDVEYLCMRCDGKSDLIPHVKKLLETCEAIDDADADTKEKMLNLGVSILGESEKASAKELMTRIQLAISKLKGGANTEDIKNVADNLTIATLAPSGSSNNSGAKENRLDFGMGTEPSAAQLADILDVEAEQVLEDLRKSQENEYDLAEERLDEQVRYLQNLYQQLDSEKSELENQAQSSDSDALFDAVREREEQIRRELKKFEEMKRVAHGFRSMPKDILKELFGL